MKLELVFVADSFFSLNHHCEADSYPARDTAERNDWRPWEAQWDTV